MRPGCQQRRPGKVSKAEGGAVSHHPKVSQTDGDTAPPNPASGQGRASGCRSVSSGRRLTLGKELKGHFSSEQNHVSPWAQTRAYTPQADAGAALTPPTQPRRRETLQQRPPRSTKPSLGLPALSLLAKGSKPKSKPKAVCKCTESCLDKAGLPAARQGAGHKGCAGSKS